MGPVRSAGCVMILYRSESFWREKSMNLAGNTVLITGGATGIGLALAERFLQAGSEVIICGRRQSLLAEAKSRHPELHTLPCDLAAEAGRKSLVARVAQEFPRLNVLINNAGIQHRTRFLQEQDWEKFRQEIAINFEAPVHLAALFIPLLQQQDDPAIVNVSSALAFVPFAAAPIYCATKAALHSFTLSLRHHLAATPIRVIEILPPAVNTDLGGPHLHLHGVPVAEFVDAVMAGLKKGELEIGYGTAEKARKASREQLDELFKLLNH